MPLATGTGTNFSSRKRIIKLYNTGIFPDFLQID